jgi:CheY-like chemotaxis protein
MAMIKKTVLVVDDEDIIRVVFSKAFMKEGYHVKVAATAEEALQIMADSPADVAFLDLKLPGMSGVDLCREIRRLWPWCIAIAVTAYASVFELVSCREAGFEDYFIKPVDMEQLLESAADAFKRIERWKER